MQYLSRPSVRVRAWLLAAGLTEGALFRAVKTGRGKDWRLTNRTIRRVIEDRSRAAGVEGRVSGHSLREGNAQSLTTAGATLVEIQVAGRWQSQGMPGHYAQGQLAQHGAVARLRHGTA